MDPKDVKPESHNEFFRFVSNTYDRPRFTLHYKTDAPISIRAVLYFPESKPGNVTTKSSQKILQHGSPPVRNSI